MTVVLASSSDGFLTLCLWAAVILFAVFYGKALEAAKKGRIVVFTGWGDLAVSSLWLYLLPFGAAYAGGRGGECVTGWLAIAAGAWVLVRSIRRGLALNAGRTGRGLAVFARLAASLVSVMAVSRVLRGLNDYDKRQAGLFGGVLLPLLLFTAVVNWLLRPFVAKAADDDAADSDD